MGTDIHTVLQMKTDGGWVTEQLDVIEGRFYELFGVLAGVRGFYSESIQKERGLPSDFQHTTDDGTGSKQHGDYWMGYHDFGWVTMRELADYDWSLIDDGSKELIDELVDMSKKAGLLDRRRLVFGFDS